MEIKTADGTKSVSSMTLGTTALGLSIGALYLQTLGNRNPLHAFAGGGHWGGGHHGHGGGDAIFLGIADNREISGYQSQIARLEAEKYTDFVTRNQQKEICDLQKEVAVEKQKTTDTFFYTQKEIACLKEYVDSHYVKGRLVLSPSDFCPAVGSSCACGSNAG